MHPAKDFYDEWASFYDAENDGQAIGDVEFYVDLARDVDGPVLEVGCGTGRVYLELLRAGVDAHGIDVSGEMLDVLESHAGEAGLSARVRRADVTEFEPARTYDLAIIPSRAFLHVLSLDDQRATLRTLREALGPDGRLALNFFAPDLEWIAEWYGEPSTETVAHEGHEYRVTSLTELEDDIEWIARERRTVERDGETIREAEFRLKLVTKREFELLLETTGWSDWAVFGGFDREPLADVSQEQVWIVEK